MSENKPFDDPHSVVLNRIYTRAGDRGQTNLAGGQRLPKNHLRIDAYGTVDELNSFVGATRALAEELSTKHHELQQLSRVLKRVQHELFNLGSILATLPEDVHPKQPRITEADITQLEQEIDGLNENLPPLRSFVLPGGSYLDAQLHICRTVCRRAERDVITLAEVESVPAESIQYLNRLSDALFVWSRWVNTVMRTPETLWEPNASASGAHPDHE